MNEIFFYTHKDCLLKDNGANHPERKERLDAVISTINEISEFKIINLEADLADINIVDLVHPKNYINKIFENIPKQGLISLEEEPYADTFLCPYSKNAILRACGAGIKAAKNLIENSYKRNFCAIRPPGHHAETIRANGFCFVNNIAVTARYLQKQYQVNKIAIIDFDVHHGNGTQEIFYNEETILYASIHQSPLFPGTGSVDEKGIGNIFNAPIKENTNAKDFHSIFENKILIEVDKFKPEIILISAGFDAHYRDPLAKINLESEDFFIITKKIYEIANTHSQGRIISFLEGGYDLIALSESTQQHLKGFF
tara:strand:+ start:5131 stop:6066 length:936 start_codon:yes stop_codon:yes gene_type:complete